jgi:hypothetical protein
MMTFMTIFVKIFKGLPWSPLQSLLGFPGA